MMNLGYQKGCYMGGVAARKAGKPVSACPYEDKAQQKEPRRQWLAGWHDGEEISVSPRSKRRKNGWIRQTPRPKKK